MVRILKRKFYAYVLCLGHPGLSLTKSPGPSGCKSSIVMAVCPKVVTKWQKEAWELKGRQGELKRTSLD